MFAIFLSLVFRFSSSSSASLVSYNYICCSNNLIFQYIPSATLDKQYPHRIHPMDSSLPHYAQHSQTLSNSFYLGNTQVGKCLHNRIVGLFVGRVNVLLFLGFRWNDVNGTIIIVNYFQHGTNYFYAGVFVPVTYKSVYTLLNSCLLRKYRIALKSN